MVVFPGSNCDHDAANAVEETIGAEARLIWHARTNLESPDLVLLPGGFSYGDYLRCGALARFSPVMDSVRDFAAKGGAVRSLRRDAAKSAAARERAQEALYDGPP